LPRQRIPAPNEMATPEGGRAWAQGPGSGPALQNCRRAGPRPRREQGAKKQARPRGRGIRAGGRGMAKAGSPGEEKPSSEVSIGEKKELLPPGRVGGAWPEVAGVSEGEGRCSRRTGDAEKMVVFRTQDAKENGNDRARPGGGDSIRRMVLRKKLGGPRRMYKDGGSKKGGRRQKA